MKELSTLFPKTLAWFGSLMSVNLTAFRSIEAQNRLSQNL
jgi:hypothetical protein